MLCGTRACSQPCTHYALCGNARMLHRCPSLPYAHVTQPYPYTTLHRSAVVRYQHAIAVHVKCQSQRLTRCHWPTVAKRCARSAALPTHAACCSLARSLCQTCHTRGVALLTDAALPTCVGPVRLPCPFSAATHVARVGWRCLTRRIPVVALPTYVVALPTYVALPCPACTQGGGQLLHPPRRLCVWPVIHK